MPDFPRSQSFFPRRLTLLYILALGTVALLSIGGQVVVQELIGQQRADSTVINMAGRQRMLSQRIAKTALELQVSVTPETVHELREALDLWEESHALLSSDEYGQGFAEKNSAVAREMYGEIEPARGAIAGAARALVSACESGLKPGADAVAVVLQNEPVFLSGMDAIVGQYEAEATARVERLRRIEMLLITITLSVLTLEGLFIFRPAVRSIRRTFERLAASEEERETISAQLSDIFDSVPALILYHDREGRIIRVNRSGAEIIGESLYKLHGSSVYELFPGDTSRFREEDAWIYKHDQARLGLLHHIRNSQGDIRWLRMNKVPYHDRDQKVIGSIIFAVDVSAHKRLERRLMELRAEQERRLGYDLHDGLGQHLSGILYLSRRLENRLKGQATGEADNAGEIVNLVKESVETVRNMSKGLRPLGDEPTALSQALSELVSKTEESTGIPCLFKESGPVLMFEADVADHLYRIAQEALNNAVRHSGADRLSVRLTQGDEDTLLEVEDNGRGIPPSVWRRARSYGRDPEGLGLGIMEHRAELMGGRLEVVPRGEGSGTIVRCIVKV